MGVTILVAMGVFCASGTALALILCGASRGMKRPRPDQVHVVAEDNAQVTQAR